jgi:hypothetical protein
MVGFAGVTPMDTRVAAVTGRARVLDTPLKVAVIVVEPALSAVASPVLPIEATAGVDEVQVAVVEIFCFEPSLYTPVAVNWLVRPTARLDSADVSEMDESVGAPLDPSLPPPHAAMSAVRPSNKAVDSDLNPSRDRGEKRRANERFMGTSNVDYLDSTSG